MKWLKRLDDLIQGAAIHLLGGYTQEDVIGIEQVYVTERDKDRQEKEALEDRLGQIEAQLADIRDRRLIAASVPASDWTDAAREHTMADILKRLDQLTAKSERRSRRSSDLARSRPRDAFGRFLSHDS